MDQSKPTILRVGITGGIGSGKSTVCRIFESIGIPIYDADRAAKRLIETDPDLVLGITDVLGQSAYADGQYQRAWVAKQVFSDPELLKGLNALVHPAVERDSRAWHDDYAQKRQVPYTIKEAALMIESGAYQHLDALIVVTAPEPLRIQRVMERDGMTETDVKARIARQLTDNQRLPYANFHIKNDGIEALVPQVWATHHNLLKSNLSLLKYL
jgi:dephospho-CoA kinase